jgi:hypothetical protein
MLTHLERRIVGVLRRSGLGRNSASSRVMKKGPRRKEKTRASCFIERVQLPITPNRLGLDRALPFTGVSRITTPCETRAGCRVNRRTKPETRYSDEQDTPRRRNRRRALSHKSVRWFLHRRPPTRGKTQQKNARERKASSRIRSWCHPTVPSERFKNFLRTICGRFSMTCGRLI